MAASPSLTGMPEIAPLKTDRAPGLKIEYTVRAYKRGVCVLSVFCLSLLRLLLVVSSRGAVEWSGGEAKGAAAWLQAAKSSAASAGTIISQSEPVRTILRLLQA
jgi:hypothetical protein